MSPKDNSATQFGDIALCLSGGGYRAAAFHLGTLRMLDKIGLLENVTMLSTVSGGTIVGASYAAWRINANTNDVINFENFFDEFHTFLTNTNVVNDALGQISQKNRQNSKDKISLICAAADFYTTLPYCNVNFGYFFESSTLDSPFEELFFNTTEFKTGLSFRFAASKNKKRVIGSNGVLSIDRDIAKNIRLADIIAASSCFPAAFEPIVFPNDFIGIKKEISPPISLMDGGIFDNQGIDSLLLRKNDDIDFYLISDTTQRNSELLKHRVKFNFAEKIKTNAFKFIANRSNIPLANVLVNIKEMTFWTLLGILLLIFAYTVFLFVHIIFFFEQNSFTFVNILWTSILISFPLILICLLSLTLFAIKNILETKFLKLISKLENLKLNEFEFNLLPFIKKITLNDLANLLIRRIDSLVTMSSSVFMKRIRSLQQELIYSDKDTRNKAVSNFIYTMDPEKNAHIWKKHPYLKPTSKMKSLSKKAETIETTLWFSSASTIEDKETQKHDSIDTLNDLDLLVECGEMTTCYSLLKFLLEKREDEIDSKYKATFQKLKDEWDVFMDKYKD